jgi:hypothetical protein
MADHLRMIRINADSLEEMRAQRGEAFAREIAGQATFDGTYYVLPLENWQAAVRKPRGLGDWVERVVKPIARVLRLACLDKNGNLKPDSGCAKRRDWLNRKTTGGG